MAEVQLYKRGPGNSIIEGVDGTVDSARFLSLGLGVASDTQQGSLLLASGGSTAAFIQAANGVLAAVSPANEGRLRYNATTQTWQVSENTGAYTDIVGGSLGGWNDIAAIVSLTTTSDTVAIGATAMTGSEKVRVVGNLRVEGNIELTGFVDPDLRIEDGGGGNVAFLEMAGGASAAVSAANEGRIRYNQTLQRFEESSNTGAYAALGGGGTRRDSTRFVLNGKPTVSTDVDNAWIAPAPGTINRVTMYRRTAGSSGSTTCDVNKNGTTIYTTQANRPSVTQASGNDQISTTTPDVTTFAQDDRIEWDIDVVEAGNPQDVALIFTVVYD